MDAIWKKIIIILLGESWEFSEYVTGIRLVDRQKKHNCLKLEIWTTLGFKNDEISDKQKKILKDNFRESLKEELADIRKIYADEVIFTEHAKKV